jgi:hypothetical protein
VDRSLGAVLVRGELEPESVGAICGGQALQRSKRAANARRGEDLIDSSTSGELEEQNAQTQMIERSKTRFAITVQRSTFTSCRFTCVGIKFERSRSYSIG